MSCKKISFSYKNEAYQSTLPLHLREGPAKRDQHETDTNWRTSY
jgi:hypothetical protein